MIEVRVGRAVLIRRTACSSGSLARQFWPGFAGVSWANARAKYLDAGLPAVVKRSDDALVFIQLYRFVLRIQEPLEFWDHLVVCAENARLVMMLGYGCAA
jgi:hypothetical protein